MDEQNKAANCVLAKDGEKGMVYRTGKGLLVTFYNTEPVTGKIIVACLTGAEEIKKLSIRVKLHEGKSTVRPNEARVGDKYFVQLGNNPDKTPVIFKGLEVLEYVVLVRANGTGNMVRLEEDYKLYTDTDNPMVAKRLETKQRCPTWGL